jgi:hypothetical protein
MLVDGLQTPSEWETASRIVGKEPPVTESVVLAVA